MSNDPRYPVGKFQFPDSMSDSERETLLQQIADTPGKLRDAVAGLDDDQLATPYRDEGWTVRQVVHHLADSHLNSYIRFKLAVTEESPTIKAYDEAAWAGVVYYIESRRFLIRDSPRPATTYEQKTGGADGVKGA